MFFFFFFACLHLCFNLFLPLFSAQHPHPPTRGPSIPRWHSGHSCHGLIGPSGSGRSWEQSAKMLITTGRSGHLLGVDTASEALAWLALIGAHQKVLQSHCSCSIAEFGLSFQEMTVFFFFLLYAQSCSPIAKVCCNIFIVQNSISNIHASKTAANLDVREIRGEQKHRNPPKNSSGATNLKYYS